MNVCYVALFYVSMLLHQCFPNSLSAQCFVFCICFANRFCSLRNRLFWIFSSVFNVILCRAVQHWNYLSHIYIFIVFYSYMWISKKKFFLCLFRVYFTFYFVWRNLYNIFFKNNFLIIVRYVIHVNLFNSYLFWIFRIIASEIFVV